MTFESNELACCHETLKQYTRKRTNNSEITK